MADGGVPLEIQFIDTPGELIIGEKIRFRVLKKGSVGQGQNVEIAQLDFIFQPIMWGQVETTEDPYVGLLRIVELVESPDVYAEPDYAISASLKARSIATILKAVRQSRMATRRVEVELIFLRGYPGAYERYDPLAAEQALDVARAFRLQSDNQQVQVRDGRIYLQCENLSDLYSKVECRLPNSETVSCDFATLIDSGAAWKSTEPTLYPRYEQRQRQQGVVNSSTITHNVRVTEATFRAMTAPTAEGETNNPIIEDPEVPLEIEFLDVVGDLVPGEELRFKVRLEDQYLEIRHLRFEFHPVTWASFEPTADPRVGRLCVLELPRPADVYDRPEFRIDAYLRARGSSSLRPRRYGRLIPGQAEVELVFYRGHTGAFEHFNPLTAVQGLDVNEAFKLSSDRHRVVTRENRIYLQCDRLADLKTKVGVTMPNGEQLTLDLKSRLDSGALWNKEEESIEAQAKPKYKPSHKKPLEGAEERALRDRIKQLRSFITSFRSPHVPDSDTAEKIRQRILARIKQTRDIMRSYKGAAAGDLLREMKATLELIPPYLRITSPEAAGKID